MYYKFYCPKCNELLTAEVDVGEHMVDWSEECETCNYKFSQEEIMKIYNDALADGFGSMIDNAIEKLKDKEYMHSYD
jgi:DNA-directed RNA polymerase subunit M/transcription elongation factor TFIIS